MINVNWSKRPLHEFIYEILKKNKTLAFEKLFSTIEKEMGVVGTADLNKALMKLEIYGVVEVITEGTSRKIFLREKR